jgi:multiple sugar transport system permease protein
MTTARALEIPASLKLLTGVFMGLWTLVALFPMAWITTMSFRTPVDALAENPLNVILGPVTRETQGGLSLLALALGLAALIVLFLAPARLGPPLARLLARRGRLPLGWAAAMAVYVASAAILLFAVLPLVVRVAEWLVRPVPLLGALAEPLVGVTLDHYAAVWITQEFHRNFVNSMVVTFGVVTVSLTVGTLAGYALARAGSTLAFWLLIVALVFRALPHSVLVTGYVPFFLQSRELLAPLWEWSATGWFLRLFSAQAPTLYGQPLAIILVLVSINQPFTIWMMRSFFANIPRELDEAARVDGCSYLGAFRRVIMPVMWPGVLTTGLFSFLLAYNDYLVTALLLDAQSQTMVPAISQFLNRDTRAADQIEAIAAAVSIAAPLFLLVMVFQKQIVAGLTQGAVKG